MSVQSCGHDGLLSGKGPRMGSGYILGAQEGVSQQPPGVKTYYFVQWFRYLKTWVLQNMSFVPHHNPEKIGFIVMREGQNGKSDARWRPFSKIHKSGRKRDQKNLFVVLCWGPIGVLWEKLAIF